MYIALKPLAMEILRHPDPKVKIRFPIRDQTITSVSTSKRNSSPSSAGPGWISTKKASAKKPPKKKKAKTKTKKKSTKKSTSQKKKSNKTAQKEKASPEVIEMLDDSSEDDDSSNDFVIAKNARARTSSASTRKTGRASIHLDDLESSDSDCVFD